MLLFVLITETSYHMSHDQALLDGQICGLLTDPYFACQAKKYSSAANGWPTRQNDTQKMRFPSSLPLIPFIFASGSVMKMSGSWSTIPAKATPKSSQHSVNHETSRRCSPITLCVGTPTSNSCKTPENKNVAICATVGGTPCPIIGE